MKKIFTLLAAALVTLTSFAADRNDGRLTIMDNSRKQLWIEVDGRRYNSNDKKLVIDNLRPGAHTVKVFAQQRYSDWGNIFKRNDRRQTVYNATVYVKPRQHTILTIDRNGNVSVEDRRDNRRYDDDWNRDDRNRDRDYDNRYDDRFDDRFDPTRSAMDVQSFEMLKKALSRENFERSRMEMARQTIDRNNFSSRQVRELALLFAFEENKLDIAKYAYGKTIDKNNFYQVYDVFSFSRSREELANYTQRFR